MSWMDRVIVRIGRMIGKNEDEMWSILDGLGWWYEGEVWRVGFWVDLMSMMMSSE